MEAGIQSEIGGEIGDLHPGEPVGRLQRHEGHQPEEQHDSERESEEAGERAPTTGMGTHRTPMLWT